MRELCERYVAVGFSKLVLVPFTEPDDWDDELAARGADAILLDPELSASTPRSRFEEAAQADHRADHADAGADRSTSTPITNTSWELDVERLEQVVLVAAAAS